MVNTTLPAPVLHGCTRVCSRRAVRAVALALLVSLLHGACAPALQHAPRAASAADALAEAARLRRFGRAVTGPGEMIEGRVVALGQQQFRIGGERFHAAQVDSFFVRVQEQADWKLIAAGAGIGALGTMFLAILAAYAGVPIVRGSGYDGALLGGGALAGGLIGAVVAGRAAPVEWQRRWPAQE